MNGNYIFRTAEVDSIAKMLETISSLPPGKEAALMLLRNQSEITIKVKVGKRPKPRPQE